MITLTEKAVEAIKKFMEANSLSVENSFLRVGVKGGGCSGLSYTLNIEQNTQSAENDTVIESNGIKVVVDNKSLLYLEGMTIDFVDGLSGSGFKFVNPNSTKTCGCGESFSV